MSDSPARKKRLREVRIEALLALRTAGAKCGNCTMFEKLKDPGMKGHFCDLTSGGGAYTIVTHDYLCTRHVRKRK